jgi:hypothetical protein
MSSPPSRFPVRSMNENKALRQTPQAYAFSGATGRPHSPTKISPELHSLAPKSLLVMPRPAGGNTAKSKILPPLTPSEGEGRVDVENCPQPVEVCEVRPRSNLRDKLASLANDAKPKHRSFEPMAPIMCEGTDLPQNDPVTGEPSEPTPTPMLKLGKRSVRKPAPS